MPVSVFEASARQNFTCFLCVDPCVLSSITGSQQWIGSTEVGFCLEELLGVQSKFLFVASGADLPSQARALAHHFDTVGTPIMMGTSFSRFLEL